ncbi:MAG: hypothetical protein ACJAU5_000600 [Maricaulis maris]
MSRFERPAFGNQHLQFQALGGQGLLGNAKRAAFSLDCGPDIAQLGQLIRDLVSPFAQSGCNLRHQRGRPGSLCGIIW